MKRLLVVFDFDGLLLNSYELLRDTFDAFVTGRAIIHAAAMMKVGLRNSEG